jgi:hypothetical protein
MNYFCQILSVQGPGGVRQTEIQTAESSVPEPSISEVEVVIGHLKSRQDVDQILAELIKAGGGDIVF